MGIVRRGARVPASVLISCSVTIFPFLRLSYSVGAPVGSTPIMRMVGLMHFTAAAIPAISQPPPIATIIVSTLLTCSMISNPIVPCPAITAGSANGWI